MNLLDRVILGLAPQRGLARLRARSAASAMMHYAAATTGRRGASWSRATGADADAAASRRNRIAYVSRDMVRNAPYATRAQAVIAANVVGDGIVPKVIGGGKRESEAFTRALLAHVDTTAIDADGRSNLYGLQRLVMNTVVESGECLIRRRWRTRADGLPIPMQIQVLEPDFIDSGKSGKADNGNSIREGIEYDAIGRRVAYWLFPQHPGSAYIFGQSRAWESKRYPADDFLHIYRQDRPGQMRGVSWFAPVALQLQDLEDYQDAQVLKQKVSACFAGFRVSPDADTGTDPAELSASIQPGRIQNLAPGEDIRFAQPPSVDGYDEFTKAVLRSVAAGMGITAEALTGDLSGVNFSSGRMGWQQMERNISAWQWLMLIPQMMQPLGDWLIQAWAMEQQRIPGAGLALSWTPPRRIIIDPNKETAALRDMVRAGFTSRQAVIREFGFDPDEVLKEQAEDARAADAAGLVFDSDARSDAAQQPAQQRDEGQANGQ